MSDQRLLELIDQDIKHSTGLAELLQQEFDALNQRNLEALQKLLEDKQPLLLQLSKNSKERSDILRQHGLESDAKGFSLFAQQSQLSDKLTQQHNTLSQLIEQCQEANLRNGRLIRTNQVTVSASLNLLRGNTEPALYDKSGSTAYKNSRRPFTRA